MRTLVERAATVATAGSNPLAMGWVQLAIVHQGWVVTAAILFRDCGERKHRKSLVLCEQRILGLVHKPFPASREPLLDLPRAAQPQQ